IVETTGSTVSGTTAAAVTGTVNPSGLATNAWFEWGTSSSLATFSSTAPQSVGSGTTAVPISVDLTGLATSTTYYYRAAASNGVGTARGPVLNFNTRASRLSLHVANYNTPSITVYAAGASGNATPTATIACSVI